MRRNRKLPQLECVSAGVNSQNVKFLRRVLDRGGSPPPPTNARTASGDEVSHVDAAEFTAAG